jgi:hypothetical protein
MPVKIARSAPRPSFGLPDLLVAIHTSRQSCSKAGKGRIFALVCESSGESRLKRAAALEAEAAHTSQLQPEQQPAAQQQQQIQPKKKEEE